MLVTDEDDAEDFEKEPKPEIGETPQLSMNSIVGFTSRQSLKVWGNIDDHKVKVLIDCGATHNFISKELVEKLQLKVDDTPSYVVEVGDGHKIKCKGVCREVRLKVQEVPVQQQFFLFGLEGIDMVLGTDWLASLGEIRANFEEQTLVLKIDGRKVIIKGEPELLKKDVSLKSMLKALHQGKGFLIDYHHIQTKID